MLPISATADVEVTVETGKVGYSAPRLIGTAPKSLESGLIKPAKHPRIIALFIPDRGFRGVPITVPNCDRKTDRLQFGTLIDIVGMRTRSTGTCRTALTARLGRQYRVICRISQLAIS